MNVLKNIFTILFLGLTVVSYGQSETKQQAVKRWPNASERQYGRIISDPTNKLTNKVEELEIEYTLWGCECPNWIRTKDNENNDTAENYLSLHFYIEPAHQSLELPIYFDLPRHKLEVTGQFYEREDYPQGTIEMEEPMPKAKVFRYTKMEVIDKPDFKPDSEIETLTLIYNATPHTRAQWSESRLNNKNDKIYYWLEPASNKLTDADTLFNGKNLPIIIKVTGQIVSENGFPKRNLGNVSKDDAGIVFRYTEIEIIQNGQKKNDNRL